MKKHLIILIFPLLILGLIGCSSPNETNKSSEFDNTLEEINKEQSISTDKEISESPITKEETIDDSDISDTTVSDQNVSEDKTNNEEPTVSNTTTETVNNEKIEKQLTDTISEIDSVLDSLDDIGELNIE